MASRTVSVELKAKVAEYTSQINIAETATSRLDRSIDRLGHDTDVMGLEVKSAGHDVNSMRREVISTGNELKALTPEVVKASKAAGLLGVEAGKAKTQAKGLGEEFGKTKTDATGLGQETDKTKSNIIELASEFHKTKAALAAMGKEFRETGKLDIVEFKSLSSRLNELQQVGKTAGLETGKGFSAGLQGSLSTPILGPLLIAGLVGAAVVAAPAVGAAIGAGVTLGVGGGALAAGIALAAKDARVQRAWGELGDDVKAQLIEAGTVFAPSLVRAAGSFGDAFSGHIMPSIRADFARLAPLVDRLAAGAAGFAVRAMPGVDKLIDRAGPLLEVLARELPNLGAAVGDFFGSIADGAPGAIVFFQMLLDISQDLIVGFGNAFEFLAKGFDMVSGTFAEMPLLTRVAFGPLAEYMARAHGKTGDLIAGIDRLRGGFDTAAPSIQLATADLESATRAAGGLRQVFDELNGTQINLTQAQINAEAAVDRLAGALEKSKGSLNLNTEAGRAAMQSGLDLARTAAEVAQKTYDETHSIDQAKAAFEVYRQQLINNIATAGGTKQATDASRQAAEMLAAQILKMPPLSTTRFLTPGLEESKSGLSTLRIQLANLDGTVVNTFVRTFYDDGTPQRGHSRYGPNERRYGGIDSYADGGIQSFARAGIYAASGPGLVKFAERETGGEAYIPRLGISQDRAMDLASKVGDWHGFNVVPNQAPNYGAFAGMRSAGGGSTVVNHLTVNVNAGSIVSDKTALARQIAGVLRPYISSNGGNVQVVLGGN